MRRAPVAVVLVLLLVAGAWVFHDVRRGDHLVVELPDAAGIRAGDPVRIAGVDVGSVDDVAATGDKVTVRLSLHRGVAVTTGTRSEVKLSSLLGQRYLDLQPGSGRRLPDGGRLPLANATGAYTIERFWLESTPTLTGLDLRKLSRAVDVLSTDLAVSPRSSRDALDGLTAVAGIVTKRDAQIGELLQATRQVTDEVVAQRDQITRVMTNADQVLATIAARRRAIDLLLRRTHALVTDLTAMAGTNARPMAAALDQLHTILGVLRRNRDQLGRTLQVAAPAMRLYVNSAGDGPWLGVNAPYFVMPDSFWCLTRKDLGCR